MKPIILHIPHSSPHIPFYDGFVIDNEAIKNEINLLTDWFTKELFDLSFPKVVAPFSRVFCDVERFENDSLEVMAQKGMGMCYTHLDSGDLMRVVESELKELIRSEFYLPHHKILEVMVTELLHKQGKATLVDCHSFPDIPLARDLNQDMPRPDFCLGIDEYHTPVDLYFPVREFLTNLGYTVLINNPYSGTMIPFKYYQKNPNVRGLMIEVNRKLYMTVEDGEILKTVAFDRIKYIIKEIPILL